LLLLLATAVAVTVAVVVVEGSAGAAFRALVEFWLSFGERW
jgi:hypothetical protein